MGDKGRASWARWSGEDAIAPILSLQGSGDTHSSEGSIWPVLMFITSWKVALEIQSEDWWHFSWEHTIIWNFSFKKEVETQQTLGASNVPTIRNQEIKTTVNPVPSFSIARGFVVREKWSERGERTWAYALKWKMKCGYEITRMMIPWQSHPLKITHASLSLLHQAQWKFNAPRPCRAASALSSMRGAVRARSAIWRQILLVSKTLESSPGGCCGLNCVP